MTDAIELLAREWHAAGIEQGDLMLMHSSLRRTLRRTMRASGQRVSPADILESFRIAVGPDGTLLFPLFNFDFIRGVPFDIRTTPSQMGTLTEVARVHPDAVRTGHPIYSFAVLGAQQELFRDVDNFSGYGADSPFAILHRNGGKIGVLDLPDQDSMTFYHYVEESKAIDYRFHKTFTAGYTDLAGVSGPRTYGLFVRDVDRGVQTDVDGMGELLWAQRLYNGDRPGEGSGFRKIRSVDLFNAVAAIIDQGRAEGLLYNTGGRT